MCKTLHKANVTMKINIFTAIFATFITVNCEHLGSFTGFSSGSIFMLSFDFFGLNQIIIMHITFFLNKYK